MILYKPRLPLLFLSLQARGQDVPGETLHEILNEIDLNLNGQVEFDEYLQVTINPFLILFVIQT